MILVAFTFCLSILWHYTVGIREGWTSLANDRGEIDHRRYHATRLLEGASVYGIHAVAFWLATTDPLWTALLTIACAFAGQPLYDRQIQLMQGFDRWTSPHPVEYALGEKVVLRYVSPKWQPLLMPIGFAIVAYYVLEALTFPQG